MTIEQRNASAVRADLAHAVTRFDRARVKLRSYNPNALGLYLRGCDRVIDDMGAGLSLAHAIEANFNDRLGDFVRSYMVERGHIAGEG